MFPIHTADDLAVSGSSFSLTSLFYGEPSEKEKSPSESSPTDSEAKDMVSPASSTELLKSDNYPHWIQYRCIEVN